MVTEAASIVVVVDAPATETPMEPNAAAMSLAGSGTPPPSGVMVKSTADQIYQPSARSVRGEKRAEAECFRSVDAPTTEAVTIELTVIRLSATLSSVATSVLKLATKAEYVDE